MNPLSDRIKACLALAMLAALLSGCQVVQWSSTPRVSTRRSAGTAISAGPTDPPPSPGVSLSASPSREATAEPAEDARADSPCDTRDDDLFRAGLTTSAQAVLGQLPGATVYSLELEIANDLLSVGAHQDVCYTNQEAEPLEEVVFRLFPNLFGGAMTVSSVSVNQNAVEPRLDLADSALWVDLDPPLQPGESVAMDVDFEVQVPQEMSGNYGLFGLHEGVLSLHEAYPVIPVYDDEGWNVELPPAQADVAYYDAAFYVVNVSVPKDLIVAASGVEIAREDDGPRQKITFAAGPARGFYLAASADYTVVSGQAGEITVNSYAPAEAKDGARLALDVATRALESFNARFGPYPYTEFDVVSTALQALGMEYPGMTAITAQVYDLQGSVRGVSAPVMLESTMAHEVAHQWFYNVVGSDQVDEPWVDEAVVQYLTGLYYLDTYGEAGYEGVRSSWVDRWDRADRADIPIGLPVRDYQDAEYGAIVYGRGPLFIEALAEEMGVETFNAFLRDYYASNAWDVGTGWAFRALAEQYCGCDLSALFSEWVYPEGTPPTAPGSGTAEVDDHVTGWAVLAEKDNYDDVDMTNMPVGHIGLEQMRAVLEDAGWRADRIQELREFDRTALEAGLDWLEDNVQEDDLVLVYVASHGRYLQDVLRWGDFFAAEWAEIPSRRRVLVVDACQAANYTRLLDGDPAPYISLAAVDGDEYGWTGLEEEGLPIIGGVFTHYFAAAFGTPRADTDGDGCVSVQEAALLAEEQQRAYMHDVVFSVPEFRAMYRQAGARPDEDPTFPDVIVDDTLGGPLCLSLEGAR